MDRAITENGRNIVKNRLDSHPFSKLDRFVLMKKNVPNKNGLAYFQGPMLKNNQRQ
jgi:hypothetical protein